MDLEQIRENLRQALNQYGTSEILQIVADIKNQQSVEHKQKKRNS